MKCYEAEVPVAEYFRDYVDIGKFKECCRKCPGFGRTWSCGPYDFNPEDYWKKFQTLRVVLYQIESEPGDTMEAALARLHKNKQVMKEYLYTLERKYPGSASLFAGSCDLCATCSRPEGQPCRRPQQMRYSIESIGGDVGRTAKDLFGIDIVWAKDNAVPPYFILCGGLLCPFP